MASSQRLSSPACKPYTAAHKKNGPQKKEAVLPKKPNFLLRLAGSLFSSCFLGSRLLGRCFLHCCLFSRRFSRRFLGGRFAPWLLWTRFELKADLAICLTHQEGDRKSTRLNSSH